MISVYDFWNKFEECLTKNVEKNPLEYALRLHEMPEAYAKATRIRMQKTVFNSGINRINLSTNTFKQVFKYFCPAVPFSQTRLKEFYKGLVSMEEYLGVYNES